MGERDNLKLTICTRLDAARKYRKLLAKLTFLFLPAFEKRAGIDPLN